MNRKRTYIQHMNKPDSYFARVKTWTDHIRITPHCTDEYSPEELTIMYHQQATDSNLLEWYYTAYDLPMYGFRSTSSTKSSHDIVQFFYEGEILADMVAKIHKTTRELTFLSSLDDLTKLILGEVERYENDLLISTAPSDVNYD